MQEEIVTIANFSDPASAQVALSVLTDAGIEAFLSGEEANSLLPNALGTRLQVRSEDQAAAEALLDNTIEGVPLTDDGNDL